MMEQKLSYYSNRITKFQNEFGAAVMPSENKVKAEVLYNEVAF